MESLESVVVRPRQARQRNVQNPSACEESLCRLSEHLSASKDRVELHPLDRFVCACTPRTVIDSRYTGTCEKCRIHPAPYSRLLRDTSVYSIRCLPQALSNS